MLVHLVAAAVHVEVCGKRNATNEEEKGIQGICSDHEEG